MKKIDLKSFPLIQKSKDFSAEKQLLETFSIRYDFISKSTFYALSHIHDFRLPSPGEQVRFRVQTQLNLTTIILKILETHAHIDECIILSFSFNRESCQIFQNLLAAGHITNFWLYVASSYTYRDVEHYERLKQWALSLQQRNCHLAFVPSHAKITLIQCEENYYQMEGSMNFTTNTRVEHLLLENRKESYEYDKQFIESEILQMNEKALEIIC